MSYLESALLVFMGYGISRVLVSLYRAIPAISRNPRGSGRID